MYISISYFLILEIYNPLINSYSEMYNLQGKFHEVYITVST